MKEEQVLIALSDLTNGALNYYQAPQTVLVRDKFIRDYIENLQSQLKAKEEVTTKLKEWLEEMLNELKQNDVYDRTSYEMGQIIATECIIAKIEDLEILSKGENK